MISRLKIKNFRAFEELDLPLKKINIFVGPNNSGKSAIMSAITLLSQTIENPDLDTRLILNGNKIELGTYRDVVFSNNYKKSIWLGIEIPVKMKSGDSTIILDCSFSYRKIKREIVINTSTLKSYKGIILKYPNTIKNNNIESEKDVSEIKERNKIRVELKHFLPSPLFPIHIDNEQVRNDFVHLLRSSEMVNNQLSSIEYIGPFREYPIRTFMFSGEAPRKVGSRGENYVGILFADFISRSDEKKHVFDKTANWLRKSGIAENCDINILTERHFEIRIQNIKSHEYENIADVGFGCSQIIPILVSGYNLPERSIFIVEQPELHLHPRAQSELCEFFYELYNKHTQSFIETHSEHLILGIQNLIAEGKIKCQDVNVYYIDTTDEGSKKIVPLQIDENGYFQNQWPGGFFPERLENARKLTMAQLKKQDAQ